MVFPGPARSASRVRRSGAEIVATLEGLRIGGADSGWFVQVVGVHPDGEDLWIQIEVLGLGCEMVLHLSGEVGTQEVIDALAAAATRGTPHAGIVQVAP